MKPKVAVGVSGLNSKKEIPRLLDPIHKHVDLIICGDGKYEFYDGPDYSTDGWLEFTEKRYKNVITYKYAGRQIDKRQKYLDIAGEENCDYLIVMDTDEYLHPDYQDWKLFYKQLEKKSKYEFLECDSFTEIEPKPNLLFWMFAWIPPAEEWQRAHNKVKTNSWKKYVRIHKNPGIQRYAYHSHFQWTTKDITDMQIARWDVKNKSDFSTFADPCPYLLRPFLAIDGVRFTMTSHLRTENQLATRDRWAWDNMFDESKRQYEECCKVENIPIQELPL